MCVHVLALCFTCAHTYIHTCTHTNMQDIDDLLGGLDISSGPPPVTATAPPPLPPLLQDPAKGVSIAGKLVRHAGGLAYHISVTNSGAGACRHGFLVL